MLVESSIEHAYKMFAILAIWEDHERLDIMQIPRYLTELTYSNGVPSMQGVG